jgi:DNA-binding MarR family transcriptional regulator
MKLKVIRSIQKLTDITCAEKVFLTTLALHIDEHNSCTIRLRRICKKYNMHSRYVSRVLTALIKKGYVTRTPAKNDKRIFTYQIAV